VPFEAVMRMALLGRHQRMSATRAYEVGMVKSSTHPSGCARWRRSWPRPSPATLAAMRATKRALEGALEHGLTDGCREGAKELVSTWGHPDQAEGPLAFAETREPRWADLD